MNQDQVFSLVRTALTASGSVLATFGVVVSGSQWETIVGGVMAIISLVWSQIHHSSAPAA